MARPAEKARAMMNKWVAMRDGEDKQQQPYQRKRRPHLASEVEHLVDAERYRNQIIHEISTKISQIQNPALPEHTIRELNDSINKLQREKFHYNKRIYQLGGLDYNMIEKKRQIEQLGNDDENASSSYYKYYGVAKDLPGVKEHLAKEAAMLRNKRMKRSDRNQNYKSITPDYYGYRDEDDGVLLELEEQATQQLITHYNITNGSSVGFTSVAVAGASDSNDTNHGEDNDSFLDGIQTQKEISDILLDIKKKALLKKYSLL
jgi:pre-mRNA-splicing factor ISY1